jgi:hypothetical protein
MAGRPVKLRTVQTFESEIQSLQRLRTAVLMGRPTRTRSLPQIMASDKAIILIDGLVECLLELLDGVRPPQDPPLPHGGKGSP